MSNQLNLPQVNSIQVVEISKDDQWKQDAPELNFESHIEGSEYFCKYTISKNLFFRFAIMGHCV
jgi:hypothetical protein